LDTHTTRERVTVILAPRINGNGFLAVIYRNQTVVTLPVASLETAAAMIATCGCERFGMDPDAALMLAATAVNRYASGVVATEEAHSLAKMLQDQLEEARRIILALTEELEAARRP